MSVRERTVLEDCFVLHRRLYRESSLLVDVFSRQHGLLRLLAKGARRAKGGHSSLLQPFSALRLSWTGRSELPTLSDAETAGGPYRLEGRALYCGFYLNELLVRLMPPNDSHTHLFVFYGDSLQRLESGNRLDETLRFFELSLLEELGYGLLLDRETAGGEPLKAEKYYAYRIDEGPRECAPGPDALRGGTLLGLHKGYLSGPNEQREAKRLMRRVLSHYLGDRPLKSRDLFKFANASEN